LLTTPRRLPWLGLVAIALLWPVAQHFRIDQVRCDSWPAPLVRLGLCLLYLLAVGLLFFVWQRLLQKSESGVFSFRHALFTAVGWHGAALFCPPFLSDDPLFYLAIGRVLHAQHPSLHAPLVDVLGPGDAVVRLLPLHWQAGTSAYQAGFHALAWLVESLPGLSIGGRLTVYQSLSALVALVTTLVCARLAVRCGKPAAYGATLFGLSPLVLLEGTLSAHNDVWLACLLALSALAWLSSRRVLCRLGLLLGLLVKLSAMLPLLTMTLSHAVPFVRRHKRWIALCLVLGLTVLAFLWRFFPPFPQLKGHLTSVLFGSPDLPWDHCTRSIECLPRSILRYGLDRPDWSYRVGVAFRLLGGLWLVRVACADKNPLSATAWGLLSYYLFWHGWAQTWYFLPVLPLRLFLSKPRGRALEVLCGSGCGYYALALYRNCTTEPWQVAVCELLEGLATVLPPALCLCRRND